MEEIQNRKQCEIMLTDTGLSGRQKHWELCIAAQADCLNIFKWGGFDFVCSAETSV